MLHATIHTMQEPKVTLGTEMRAHRERAGMSQERLAEALGVSRETVSKIERGDTKRPNNELLRKLEHLIGLSYRRALDLMGEVEPAAEDPLEVLLIQIAALPDREARRQAWQALPDSVRDAILRLAGDVWQDTLQQLQVKSQGTSPAQAGTSAEL